MTTTLSVLHRPATLITQERDRSDETFNRWFLIPSLFLDGSGGKGSPHPFYIFYLLLFP